MGLSSQDQNGNTSLDSGHHHFRCNKSLEDMERCLEEARARAFEEQKEICIAAFTLIDMKHRKLKEEDAIALNEMKSKTFPKVTATPIDNTRSEVSFNDNIPQGFPMIQNLNGLVRECKWFLEKQLQESDVKDNQSRLILTKSAVQSIILGMLRVEEDPYEGIEVRVYNSEGKEFPMTLKYWASNTYVLTTGWKEFYKKHNLIKHEDFITMWVFRHAHTIKLCFIITWTRKQVSKPLKKKNNQKDKLMEVSNQEIEAKERKMEAFAI
ncbi:hypothetical protein HHK36_014164 [Tetracentron sinense]|uniref:TF-B3 domain-containing protein n=1 Tax=Tetracentron sinense TaxID=13715 RepID=A0A835DF69_TETSI|nr:hypothetical protein HHK36_014164 [Tetracentron sinense]